jgi:glycine betaine catabolism B
MFRIIQRQLDSFTMYSVVLVGLSLLVGVTLGLSALGTLRYSSFANLLLAVTLLISVCGLVNILLARLFKIPSNLESSLITALILFFVLQIPDESVGWLGIAYAGLVAMASKYVVTWHRSNIFNPAALGVLIVSLIGVGNGGWWVANEALFIPVVLLGIVVLIKLRKFSLFAAFMVPAAGLIMIQALNAESGLGDALILTVMLYPLVFLGTIMLTEPGTMPSTRNYRLVFGGIVGIMMGAQLGVGPVEPSPHLALLVGNVFAFVVTMRPSVRLRLISRIQLSPTTYEFAFQPNRKIPFKPGQYMDFTLAGVRLDKRGNRRTFTIASQPGEKQIRIAVKFYNAGSQFKARLLSLKKDEEILGNHMAGDFLLPASPSQPLVFVAGGIGVTPYISMLKHLLTNNESRDITLYYFANDKSEIVYKDVLEAAESIGLKTVVRIGKGERLRESDIKKHRRAHFYLSGPPALVSAYKSQLKSQGINHIHTDNFTGY